MLRSVSKVLSLGLLAIVMLISMAACPSISVNPTTFNECIKEATVSLLTDIFTRGQETAREVIQLATGINEASATVACMTAVLSAANDELSQQEVDIHSQPSGVLFTKPYQKDYTIQTQRFDTRQLGNCPGRQYLNPAVFNGKLVATFPHSLAVGKATFDSLPTGDSDEAVIARALYKQFSGDFAKELSAAYAVQVPPGQAVASLTVPFTFTYTMGTAIIRKGNFSTSPVQWAFPSAVTSGQPKGISLQPCSTTQPQFARTLYTTTLPGCDDTNRATAQWFDAATRYRCVANQGLIADIQAGDELQPTFNVAFAGLLPTNFDMGMRVGELQAPKSCAGVRMDDSDVTDVELFVCNDGSRLDRRDVFDPATQKDTVTILGQGSVAPSGEYDCVLQVRDHKLTWMINQQTIATLTAPTDFAGFYASSLVLDTDPQSDTPSTSNGEATFQSFSFTPVG